MKSRPKKILVVDDQPLLAETLGAILSDAGYETAIALSGEEGLAVAQTFRPDCLLTDVSMPGIDGIETAISVQKMLPRCRVLLISGHAGTKDLLRQAIANGHGFDVLPKPVHPTDLIAKISDLFSQNPEPLATILNVDDNEIHRYAVSLLLTHQGFSVKEASSGEQALQIAFTEKPDVVLLDINMPGINGFEVCRRLKADPRTATIPVIHLTNTYKNEESRQISKTCGATEYLKPLLSMFVDSSGLMQVNGDRTIQGPCCGRYRSATLRDRPHVAKPGLCRRRGLHRGSCPGNRKECP